MRAYAWSTHEPNYSRGAPAYDNTLPLDSGFGAFELEVENFQKWES